MTSYILPNTYLVYTYLPILKFNLQTKKTLLHEDIQLNIIIA